jgi:hypothetical protein
VYEYMNAMRDERERERERKSERKEKKKTKTHRRALNKIIIN